MSTLKTNNIEHLDASSPNIELSVGGGVVVSGVSTFNNDVNFTAAGGLNVTSGNVGIGTDNPDRPLHVFDGTNDANVKISSTGSGKDARLELIGNSTGVSQIRLGDEASVNVGSITYDHSDDSMFLRTNSSERLRIDSSGFVGINTTNPQDTLHVSGEVRISDASDVSQRLRITHEGIDFQNTGTGSSTGATAHLLNDYEEGTWTPEVADGITGGNVATGTFNGVYTRVGRLVTISFDCANVNTSGMTGGNTLIIRNIPFSVITANGTIRFTGSSSPSQIALSGDYTYTSIVSQDSLNYLRILQQSTNSSDPASAITISQLNSGSADLRGSVTYFST